MARKLDEATLPSGRKITRKSTAIARNGRWFLDFRITQPRKGEVRISAIYERNGRRVVWETSPKPGSPAEGDLALLDEVATDIYDN